MRRVYLDNAATSWPKPTSVYEAVTTAMCEIGAPAGRSAYAEATDVERLIAETRGQLAEIIAADDPQRIIFTFNATDSLNLAIHGTLDAGDHVVTSVLEHNSVLRPLRRATGGGVEVTHVGCNASGWVDPREVEAAIRPNTRMIVLTHASNVTGVVQACEEVGQIAQQNKVLFLVDASQTAGHWPIDVSELGCSYLAAPGHKGLLGPLGVGLLYIAPGLEHQLRCTRQGGTGTRSDSDEQPETLPHKYESGNHNVPGILGLRAGLQYIREHGVEALRQLQQALTARLLDGLRELELVTVVGSADPSDRVGVVSVSVAGYDPQEVAGMLDAAYRIQVRSGLHCAPLTHRALGTSDGGGTVRLSLGPFNTNEDIDLAIHAIAELTEA